MNSFAELGIKPDPKKIIGHRKEMKDVIGIEIIIHHYNIGPSKYPNKGNGLRLDMQIELDKTKYLLRTGSTQLQYLIGQVPENKFPITTTIQEDGESFKFT